MKKLFTITELSNLTHKSRPTLYKYINGYDNKQLSDIPYLFVQLFMLIDQDGVTSQDVIKYCEKNFTPDSDDESYKEFMLFIQANKEKIDFSKALDLLKKEYKGEIPCQQVKKNF